MKTLELVRRVLDATRTLRRPEVRGELGRRALTGMLQFSTAMAKGLQYLPMVPPVGGERLMLTLAAEQLQNVALALASLGIPPEGTPEAALFALVDETLRLIERVLLMPPSIEERPRPQLPRH
ncbi:MAG: hypothetical protein WCI05_04210 [Myxococcales bacterium]